MDSVTPRHAFLWECPVCKKSNEAKCMPVRVDDEMLRKLHGIEEWQELPEGIGADAMQIPETVNCQCGEIFKLEAPTSWQHEPEEGEDDHYDDPPEDDPCRD